MDIDAVVVKSTLFYVSKAGDPKILNLEWGSSDI